MAKKRFNKVELRFQQGTADDTPIGHYLQTAYWKLCGEMKLTPAIWKDMAKAYVNDPRYVGRSTADAKERQSRLATALTSGSIKGLPVDLTWKRFIEGLVLIHVETLTMTVQGSRGNFGAKKTVAASCHPHLELLKIVNREDEEVVKRSASNALNHYFKNPRDTADRIMEHILLKILWGFFAEYNIRSEMWHKLSLAYVNNPKNCPALSNRRSDMRHNLESAIRYTKKITWKRFLQALKAIDMRSFQCTFKATNRQGQAFEYQFEVDLTEIILRSNSDGTE